jgi:hypothetical protein
MPDVAEYDNEDEWMEECVSQRMDEGDEQDRAVAACLNIWRNKSAAAKARGEGQGVGNEPQGDGGAETCVCPQCGYEMEHDRGTPCNEVECPECGAMMTGKSQEEPKAFQFDMLLTKAEQMADGRTRWQARANTGQWDLEHERFDATFWEDVVSNFSRVQEAMTRSEDVGLPIPILDISHYSFRLPAGKRNLARAGYPIKVWQDGQALMAQGYFDDTPLGRAAAKAAASRPVAERRVSVGVWPDWGRVELDEHGRRTYKGGRARAYLDHLAMTAHPVDPGTILEVKSMTQKEDALDVLGEEAKDLVDELEEATTKANPEGAIVKTDGEEPEAPDSPEPIEEPQPAAEPAPDAVTADQLRDLLQNLFESFKSNLDERLGPVEAAVGEMAALRAQVDALGATETEKVKAAVDSPGGEWWEMLVRNTVQRREKPVEGPKETARTDDPFYQVFPGLRKE